MLIRDFIVGMWYLFGYWLIKVVFPGIKDDIEVMKSVNKDLRNDINTQTAFHAQQIQELVELHREIESDLVKDYESLERRFGEVSLKLEELTAKPKKKVKEAVNHPIKSRAGKKK